MDNGRDNDCDVKVVKIVEQLERNQTWFSSPSPLVKIYNPCICNGDETIGIKKQT